MKSPILLILVLLLCIGYPGQGLADSSTTVCGVPLDQKSAFSWTTFNTGRGSQFRDQSDRQGVIQELRKLFLEQSGRWPEEIRQPAVTSIDNLVDGSGAIPDFTLSKNIKPGEIQASQFIVTTR